MRKVKGDETTEGATCPDKARIRHYQSERSRIRSCDQTSGGGGWGATDSLTAACIISLPFSNVCPLICVSFRNIPIGKKKKGGGGIAKLDWVGAKVGGGVPHPRTSPPEQWHCPSSLSCLQVLSETAIQAPINVLPLIINTAEQFQILLQEHQ